MIKASELRIGNAIWDDTLNKIKWVNHRVISDIASHPNPLPYSPIPITPEWLERCGFKRMNAGWINNSGSLSFYDKSQDANGYYRMEYGTRNYNARFLFVHQLQNLYFALTVTELKINDAIQDH